MGILGMREHLENSGIIPEAINSWIDFISNIIDNFGLVLDVSDLYCIEDGKVVLQRLFAFSDDEIINQFEKLKKLKIDKISKCDACIYNKEDHCGRLDLLF